MPLANSAKYPSAVAGASDLLNQANFTLGETLPTLAAGIGSGDTSFSVAAGTGANLPTDNFVITVDQEIIFVGTRTVDALSSIVRGVQGTSAASHASGANVNAYVVANHHNQTAAEINAIETALGANLGNVIPKTLVSHGADAFITTGQIAITVGASPASANLTTLFSRDWLCPAGTTSIPRQLNPISGFHTKITHEGPGLVNTFDWVAGGNATVALFTQNDNISITTGADDTNSTSLSASIASQGIDTSSSSSTGWGFRFTVPADSFKRTLTIYLGSFSAAWQVSCTVSDGSSSPVTTTFDPGANAAASKQVSIVYNSSRDGQSLEVSVLCTVNHGSTPNIKCQAIGLN